MDVELAAIFLHLPQRTVGREIKDIAERLEYDLLPMFVLCRPRGLDTERGLEICLRGSRVA